MQKEKIEKLKELVLPEASINAYKKLIKKRDAIGISEVEQKQLEKLIKEDLILQTKRIHILGELAKLRKQSVLEVMQQLGLQTP